MRHGCVDSRWNRASFTVWLALLVRLSCRSISTFSRRALQQYDEQTNLSCVPDQRKLKIVESVISDVTLLERSPILARSDTTTRRMHAHVLIMTIRPKTPPLQALRPKPTAVPGAPSTHPPQCTRVLPINSTRKNCVAFFVFCQKKSCPILILQTTTT